MHILDSSENYASEDHVSDSGSDNNPVLEVEDNLNQAHPPLTPIINNVLPPTGEVNFNALPSLASLLSIPSSNASSIASPSTTRITRRKRKLPGCKDLLSDKELKKRGRGSFSQVVDNDKKITIVKWYDNKVVTLACSYADAYPVQEIKRWSKEQKKKIGVTCPQLVRHYNQHMGGVDLCDMLIALYRTSFKSRRWYMNIFGQMLDIAVNNAWLLYRRNCAIKSLKNISLKKFRQRLTVELRQTGRSIETDPPSPVPKKALIQNPSAVSVSYDGFSHWPEYTTYGRCKFCKNNKTNIHCSKCKQRLCLVTKRNCFYNFHNK